MALRNRVIAMMQWVLFTAAGLLVLLSGPAPALAQSVITTYAGGLVPSDGAQADTQAINEPRSVVSDRAGGFYFTTYGPTQHRVYHVSPNGTLKVIAGIGSSGFSGDGGPAVSAQLNTPGGIALDSVGNLFIADSYNYRIRKVTPAGTISTVAGNGLFGFTGDGGAATSARISSAQDVAVDGSGNLFIADSNNNRIRRVTASGIISTIAGNGAFGFSGEGGQATSAQLAVPNGIDIDANGNLFIADSNNNRIRRVTPGGIITTVAGAGAFGFSGDGGIATLARIYYPSDVAVDATGALLIADSSNSRVRKVTPAGVISTIAGNGTYGFSGDGGPATSAQLTYPMGVAADANGSVFIVDGSNYRIRKVTPGGTIHTVAGNGAYAFGGDGGPATLAVLNNPNGIALDSAGNLFIADTSNHRIRKVSPAGVISTFAGNGAQGSSGDGGPATSAQFDVPYAVAVNQEGDVFIADCSNHIRKVLPAGTIDSFPSGVTWAFCTYYYYYYYDNFARAGLAVDAGSNLFVADTENNRVHKVTPAGAISLAGGGFNGPLGVAVDAQGNLFIADQFNHRVQKITAGGIISTVAGTGASGFSGDGGAATLARLFSPSGVAVDVHGNLFIADLNNHRIRRVTPGGIISTVAGNGSNGFSGDGGAATSAQLNYPSSVAVDAVGNLFISDTNNHRIRRVGFAPTVPTLAHLSTSFGAQGMTMNVALGGTSFTGPLTINAGSGITASNVAVVSDILATATFTIDSNATPGSRNVTVTTGLGTSGSLPFNVVLPFPDLSITATRTGNLGVGFEGVLAVNVTNHGTAAATGLTVTDTLPSGLTFVSGSGDGWSCSAEQQAVTCVNPNSLAAGASTGVNLAVAVGAGAISGVSHSLKVAGDGDLVASNDTATAVIVIATPAVNFRLDPPFVAVGGQSTLDLTIPTSFPYDVTGTLTLAFVSNAAIPANDPAIQFATGGRTVTFTIPANTLQARFDASTQAGPIGFQVGTVSGALSFSGVLQTGALQTSFSTQQTVPKTAPAIHSVQDQADGSDLDLAVSFYSTPREVTQLTLRFSTTPAVHLSCGTAPGCLVAGNALVLDVKSVFDTWYAADVLYGSAGSLHIPLTIQGTVKGSLVVSLRNSLGTSNTVSLPLP